MNAACKKQAAAGRIGHPARHVASLPWELGGVSLVDLELQGDCLRAKNAARLLHPARHPWKDMAARRLASALPALGPAAPLSALQITHRLPVDARVATYLQALQRTLPHRLMAPAELSADQVRAERLFHNRQIRRDGQPLAPAAHATLADAGVFTVGQLQRARQAAPTDPALQLVWECLPAEWQQRAADPPSLQWRMLTAADGSQLVLRTPLDAALPDQLCPVLPDGSLGDPQPPPAAFDPAAWQPCCVLSCLLQPARPQLGEALFLVGPWEDLAVDPSVWGHGNTCLLSYTVKAATCRRILLRAVAAAPRYFSLGAGYRPALWPLPGGEPGPSAAATGLQAAELRWESSHRRRLEEEARPATRRRAAEHTVSLLDCQRPGKRTRLGVHARLALREEQRLEPAEQPQHARRQAQRRHAPLPDDTTDALALAAPPDGPTAADSQAQQAHWRRLLDADLPRDQYGLAYRLAHGSLYVAAFLCHVHALSPGSAYCTHPACAELQLESLTHAFIACPAVAPAAAWLCSLFAAVSGQPPPPVHPQVLLADNPSVWSPQPSSLQFLWTNMRMSFLASVWRLRCRRTLAYAPFTPLAVAGAVVSTLRSAIWRDWTRATRDLTRLEPAYWEWFRGRDPALDMVEFEARWAHGSVLCQVVDDADPQHGLRLRLSVDAPVPAPGPAPDPVPAPEPAAAAAAAAPT